MFKELLILTRGLNLVYHQMHNAASGSMFFADHAELAGMYGDLDSDYDSLVERRIGLTGSFDRASLVEVLHEASELVGSMPESEDMHSMFSFSDLLEKSYVAELKRAEAGQSSGTVNMLQGLADMSEVRQYKIQRRLK